MRLFTSEAVTEGHPDKLCDQISDTILDAILTEDPDARVAVEAMATTGLIHVAGEVTTTAWVDIPELIRDLLVRIGYDSSEKGFDGRSCGISVSIGAQSSDIAQGLLIPGDAKRLQGAGDQGIMFGFATAETEQLMPLPITMAHQLATKLTDVRKQDTLRYLRPDGKTQVTIGYDGERPVSVDTIVVSAQHKDGHKWEDMAKDIRELVVKPVLREHPELDTKDLRILFNPTGKFVIGGPQGDAGLTGRKIIVDTYGGAARHGGGAFSGKDPSKVDRSAAYAARWVAKHVVASGLARKCEIQLAYAIGVAEPVGVYIDTFNTGQASPDQIARGIRKTFDLRPGAIIDQLDLLRPIYAQTATGGHFGRPEFTWEQTPLIIPLLDNVH